MLSAPRTLIAVVGLALVAAGCGGGPARPSGTSVMTIAGTVQMSGGAALAPGSPAASGLTVSIVGTGLSATVESSGRLPDSGGSVRDGSTAVQGMPS